MKYSVEHIKRIAKPNSPSATFVSIETAPISLSKDAGTVLTRGSMEDGQCFFRVKSARKARRLRL